jgi:hypothetical protein
MSGQTNIVSEPSGVNERLASLGLSQDVLRGALLQAWRFASECTKHDPPNLGGILVWGKAIRYLRDELVPHGWKAENRRNYATVVSRDGRVALAVSAADSMTGLEGPVQPCTRCAKGEATREALNVNQLTMTFADFADYMPEPRKEATDHTRRQTWVLLHYVDEQKAEIRLELSLPVDMNDQHHVTRWDERILLEPIPELPEPFWRDDDDDGGLDIPIRPRN